MPSSPYGIGEARGFFIFNKFAGYDDIVCGMDLLWSIKGLKGIFVSADYAWQYAGMAGGMKGAFEYGLEG